MDAIRWPVSRRVTSRALAISVMVVGLVVPMLTVILSRSDRSTGDIALIELRTRDVLSANPPLVGAYSRYGWSHPGPLMFYVFALPYRLLGGDADALRLTTLAFNAIVIVVIMWIVARRGSAASIAVAAATVATTWGLLPHSLSEGWNVTVAILPFLLTLVACWCAICGDRWALLVAGLSFAFVFQAHIGFGLVLVPLVAGTVGWLWWHAWQREHRVKRSAVAGTGLVAAMFVPVVYDIVAHWPGNFGRLAKWSLNNDEPKVGLGEGLRIIGRTSSLSFLSHPQFPGRFVLTIESVATGFLPWTLLVLLIAATAVSARRGLRAELVLCLCLMAAWIAGVVAAASIAEPLLPWLIDWLQPLGWTTWAAIALVAWRACQARVQRSGNWPRLRTMGIVVISVVFVTGTVEYAHETVTTNYLSADSARAVDQLTAGAATVGNHQPIAIVYEGDPLTAGTMMNAVVNQLDGEGFQMCVDAELAHQFGSTRVCAGRPGQYLMVRSEPFETPAPAGATTLAISDPLSAAERVEADTITQELSEILIAFDRADAVPLLYSPLARLVDDDDPPPELISRSAQIERLNDLRQIPGTRYGLYLVPV